MWFFEFVVRHWILSLGLTSFVVFIVLQHQKLKERKQQDEERRRKLWAQERAKQDKKWQENIRRAEARKQWLVENKPKLYYNTVNGVTAVLRPVDYATAQKDTARARRDGFWEKDNVLQPARNTFTFVTKQSREIVLANASDFVVCYKIAGFISQLDDIVELGGVELIKTEEIFVPWVNESLVSYNEQSPMLQDCSGTGSYFCLVETQAPAELQPVL